MSCLVAHPKHQILFGGRVWLRLQGELPPGEARERGSVRANGERHERGRRLEQVIWDGEQFRRLCFVKCRYC